MITVNPCGVRATSGYDGASGGGGFVVYCGLQVRAIWA